MYESFYQMKEKPFQINTDPRFLWQGEKHKEALANLKYGLLDRNGFVVLTGDVGTGKTTLVNALINALGENVRVVKVNHPSLETREFLTFIAKTLNPDFQSTEKSDLLLFFNAYLQQAYMDGKVVLLIIDEAHRLSMGLLEEIWLLSNIEHEGQPLLSIFFVGQSEIKPMLRESQCRALRQRITLFYDIQALLPEETRQYIGYRLQVAGISKHLFTEKALQKIHSLSGGNPRVINILCDRALLTGYVRGLHVIGTDIVVECGRETDLGDHATGVGKSGVVSAIATRWQGTVGKLGAVYKAAWKIVCMTYQTATTALNKTFSRAGSIIKAYSNQVKRSTAHLLSKHRRKLLPVVLVSSFGLFFAAVAISAFSGARLHGKPSAAQIMVDPQREPQMPSESTAEGSVVSTSTAQVKSFQNDRPSNDLNPELVESDSTPIERAAAALGRKDYQKALQLLEARPMGTANEDADSWGLYARALIGRAGELMGTSPDEAEAMLIKAIEVSPKMAEPHLMLGNRYIQIKDYARALSAYQRVIALNPSAADALFNLGFIYATTGDFEAAENAFERVVSLKPAYMSKSLFNLAVVQQKLGKREQSIANLEEAVAMGPENEKALAFLNRLRQSAMGDAGEQIR